VRPTPIGGKQSPARVDDGEGQRLKPMILLGLGANLPSPAGPPLATLEAALAAFTASGVTIAARSRWYRTAPVPVSDQPWFINGVARVETSLEPLELLKLLQKIERQFGRRRGVRNEARTLDLDIIDYDGRVEETSSLVLPHPRMHERGFVLLPLAEIAPGWRHPRLGETVSALISALPTSQKAEPIGG
jgi:2-amino-4-hydroxy-6-hydroxymethyldihydropteridine diphosphokinase